MKVKRFTIGRTIIFTFLCLWTLSFFICVFWLFMSSLKGKVEYSLDKVGFPEKLLFENYSLAFTVLSSTGKSVPVMIFNSLWRVLGTIIISQIFCNAVAYVLAKYKFPGRDFLYWLSIMVMMIPIYGSMPATLKLYNAIGIYDSPFQLIAATNVIGSILIPYSCYKNLSWTYAEAAFVEGAGHFRVFFQIMLPQMSTIIIALSVTAFVSGWNDYMTSIVYMPSYPTLATGLYIYQIESKRKMNYPTLYAGLIMSVVPVLILFVCCQNTFMELDIGRGLKG